MPFFSIQDPFITNFWDRDFFVSPISGGNDFELNLNLQYFKPEEITIKLTENNLLIIEGKQEEKKEKDGSISRQFVKKCMIPEGYDVSKVQSKFYSSGILTISAPKLKSSETTKVKNIPITRVKKDSVSLKSKL